MDCCCFSSHLISWVAAVDRVDGDVATSKWRCRRLRQWTNTAAGLLLYLSTVSNVCSATLRLPHRHPPCQQQQPRKLDEKRNNNNPPLVKFVEIVCWLFTRGWPILQYPWLLNTSHLLRTLNQSQINVSPYIRAYLVSAFNVCWECPVSNLCPWVCLTWRDFITWGNKLGTRAKHTHQAPKQSKLEQLKLY